VFEKRKILNFVASKSSWKDGKLTVNYRKSFDSLVVTKDELNKINALWFDKTESVNKWLAILWEIGGLGFCSSQGNGLTGFAAI